MSQILQIAVGIASLAHGISAAGAVLMGQGAEHNFRFANLPVTGFDPSEVGEHRAVLQLRFTGNLLNFGETVTVAQYEDELGDSYSGGDYEGSPRADVPGVLISHGTSLSNPGTKFWEDLQGVVRVKMTAGSLMLDYIKVTVIHDGAVHSQQTSIHALSLLGDFDIDQDVDGTDLLNWQRGISPNPMSAANLSDWRATFADIATLAAAKHLAVPEPATWMLLGIGAAVLVRLNAFVAHSQPRR